MTEIERGGDESNVLVTASGSYFYSSSIEMHVHNVTKYVWRNKYRSVITLILKTSITNLWHFSRCKLFSPIGCISFLYTYNIHNIHTPWCACVRTYERNNISCKSFIYFYFYCSKGKGFQCRYKFIHFHFWKTDRKKESRIERMILRFQQIDIRKSISHI